MSHISKTFAVFSPGIAMTSADIAAITGLEKRQSRKAIWHLLEKRKVVRIGKDYPPLYQRNPELPPPALIVPNEPIVRFACRTQPKSVWELAL